MEFGSKLKDLNMTPDEIGRFTKAFQNDEFRKMLHEYAEEISTPENKKKYEEEIKLLEQERGMDIQFVHPEPYRALKTSMDGRQKCFINVCSNDMIRKPEFRRVDEAGRVGQHWSLPHSLTPGTPDRDAKGNKYTIYDVVFHPDTIHMAGNNPRFMEMVDNTAVEAVENGGKVKLDKNNVRVLKIKYKGTPHPAVMRKPLPGQPAKEKPPLDDHLSFPYPDEKQPDTESPKPKAEIQSDTQISQRQQNSNSPKEPTKPNYTLKYRSFIDLQDFRCSRDSAQSPRPKEIVITIDLPLLRSVADADLDVTERLVSLKSKKPAYRLEVPMAYPVDENKGDAKFNKQKKQLVVTLPVLPLKEPTVAEVSGRQLVNDDAQRSRKTQHVEKKIPPTTADVAKKIPPTTTDVIEETFESQAPTKDKQKTVRFSEHVEVAQSQEDDLPAEQTFQDCHMRPQQALLTEINQDGQEVVISDHTTSAGFVFQNSFIYDLD
uniref:Protein kintoun n=1 Tax=Hucho hucho TaxID=62062 RepID=A0A4W5ND41_9TELE